MNGHYKCVDALVRYGVEVNTRFDFPLFNGTKTSSTLMTPIMLACMYGQSQMVNLLLAYNANCMLTDSSDSNVLHYALNEGPNAVAVFTILHNLLEEINLKQLVLAADKKGYTPLHNACISNHVDVIPILVSLGCNVDIRTRPPKVRENVLERTLRKSNNLGVEFKTSDFCKSIRMIDLTDKDDEVEVEVEGADVKGMKMLGDNSKSNGVSGEMKCDTSIPSLGALKSGQKTPSVAVETVLPSTLLLKPEDEVKKKKELENGTEKEVEKEGVEKGGVEKGGVEKGVEKRVEKGVEKRVEKGVEKGVEIGVENGIEIEKGIDKGNDNVKNRRKSSFSSDGIAWGVTPLHIAVKRRSIAAVTSLLNAHADPCAKDDLGVSPLDMAKKLRADSPILLKLSKAAAEKQKIIVPMPMPISTPLHVSVRITEKILCLGIISEEGEELESTIISNIEVPKNVPKNVPENVPENVPMNAVAVCSERNRVIEEHILKTIQIATQNAIKKIVYSSQIA